jgi:hypothetical protein
MIKVYINEVEINVDDKIALNSAFNETLDTGVIIIPNSSELSIKRMDKAVIANGSNNRKYFRVGTVVKEYETFEKPYKYKYTVELVSPTIDLQNIVLPNISITQPSTTDTIQKRSIYYQINRLVSVFAPEFTISNELKNLTESIICPENQYNRKTLFEILNDLLINVPAVVTVLEDNVISCIELDKEGTEINHNKIINIVETKKIDEYCSEIEINAENVVGDASNTTNDILISPRSEEYIMTTDNAQIILDKPIYSIDKVEVFLPEKTTKIYYLPNGGNIATDVQEIDISNVLIDITKYVVEESVYNTKLPEELNIIKVLQNGVLNPDLKNYKRAFLSFVQGSNVINNLSYREKGLFGTIDQFALGVVHMASVIEYALKIIPSNATLVGVNGYDSSGKSQDYTKEINDPRKVQFKVTYTSQTSLRFRVKKPNTDNTNYKLLIDNQSNSYVDASSLWNAELENAKRIGNPELKINMVFNSIEEIPTHPAKFEDYVMTNYVVNIYQNKVLFEGYFTKDFIRKNLYTGLKSKARWTSIAKGSEALSRQDLIIIDYDFTIDRGLTYSSSVLGTMLENITTEPTLSVKADTGYGYLVVDKSVYNIGNNLLFSFNFKDNFNAGMAVDSIKSSKYVMSQVPYVNVRGEFNKLQLQFYEKTKNLTNIPLSHSKSLPKTNPSTGGYIQENEFLVMKDNREIYGADVQLRFNSNDEVIIFNEFINHYLKTTDKELFYFGFANRTLTKEDKNIKQYQDGEGGAFDSSLIDYEGLSQPTWQNLSKEQIKCWGICNTNYDVLLVCNSNADKIYHKEKGSKLC